MLHNLVTGLTTLGAASAIGYLIAGTLLGVFIGVIPGLGGSVVLSIVLSFAYHIPLTGTLCLFLGAHAGSYFSASVTSILLNAPAHPEAFPVTFDGFPMARKGQAGRALGISAASTCIGGLVGCAVLVGFIQIINNLGNFFHPPEYVALVLLAMILVGTLGSNSVAKPLISAGLGIMVASIGPSLITGQYRFTFNQVGLYGGASLVAVALGLFAVPQMIMVFGTGTSASRQDMTGREIEAADQVELEKGFGRQVLAGVADTFRHRLLLLQSGLVGSLVGIVPGIGGFAANFMSYGIAQQTQRKQRANFGTGIAEGIIAPEGSSLAKEAGSLVPIIGLGIPGSVGGSLFIAALTIKGIQTGFGFSTHYPTLPYEMVWILAIAGILGTVVGVLIAPVLAKVTGVPGPILMPFILSLAVLGPFLANVEFFAVYEVLIFGVVGLVLRRLRYSLASFVIGVVLGPTFETNVYLTHNVYPGFSFLSAQPAADAIFAIAIAVLVLKVVQIRRENARETEALTKSLAQVADPAQRAAAVRRAKILAVRYPLLNLILTVAALALALFCIFYASANYDLATKLMPIIGGLLVAVPAVLQLPRDIQRYLLFRRERGKTGPDAFPPPAGPALDAEPTLDDGSPREDAPAPVSVLSAVAGGPASLGAAVMPVPAAVATATLEPGQLPAITENAWGRAGQFTREFAAYLWLIGLVLGAYLVGFTWAIGAFVLLYGLTCTRRYLPSVLWRTVFSVVGAVVMAFVVYEALKFAHVAYIPRINL
jgi:putative tricarboxylic transport membrane protein